MKLKSALIVSLLTTPIASANFAIFGSPPFDAETGDGYKVPSNAVAWLISTSLANDGTVLSPLIAFESNVEQFRTQGTWRTKADYTIYPLNPNYDYVSAMGLNDIHQAVGEVGVVDGLGNSITHFGRWDIAGNITILSLPSESEADVAVDINDHGTVAGVVRKPMPQFGSRRWAVRWSANGNMTELPIPGNYGINAESYSVSINDSAQIVGAVAAFVDPLDQNWFPVRWEPNNTVTELPLTTTSGVTGVQGVARNINSSGAAAGEIAIVEGNFTRWYGVYWTSEGEATLLQTLPIGQISDTFVYDMNDQGEVLGLQQIWNGTQTVARVAKWLPNGSAIELQRYNSVPNAPDPYPMEINDFGYAVGRDGTGVLWKPDGSVISLRSLLPENSEWTSLSFGIAISDTGWISGRGGFNPAGDAPAYTRDWAMLLPFAGTYGLGDANFDESIDFNDLLIVAQNYGHNTNGSVDVGDFNLDGVVDFNDLLVIAQNYGSQPTSLLINENNSNLDFGSDWTLARSMVPEPSVLSIVGMVMLISRGAQRRPFVR